ncbi:MAG: transporter ATP-binding protein, partial [Pseudonocardiales bacterium]|nr:transporter ATP-binding protein [Pseudonocardiales bacterium]
IVRLTLAGDTEGVLAAMYENNFIRPNITIDDPQGVLDYLRPLLEPLEGETFTFTREWMREQAARIGDPRSEAARIGRQLNVPAAYLLIHRVTLGSIGVLCQLGATARYREIVERWQPGFATP